MSVLCRFCCRSRLKASANNDSLTLTRSAAGNPKLFGLVAKDITQGIKAEPAKVVAISGRSISRDKHLWGDIAAQLGKPEKFLEFYKGAPIAPNEKDWIELIGDPRITACEFSGPALFAVQPASREPIRSGRIDRAHWYLGSPSNAFRQAVLSTTGPLDAGQLTLACPN
jgi:hypothetical protein